MKLLKQLSFVVVLSIFQTACFFESSHYSPLPNGTHRLAIESNVDKMHLEVVAFPDKNFPEINVSKGMTFSAYIDPQWNNELVLVRAKRSNDAYKQSADYQGESIETNEGTPGEVYASVLVLGRDLNEGSVSINPITDYIATKLLGYVDKLPQERIRYYQDEIAQDLFQYDISGDGVIDYQDALRFDPSVHTYALTFDYVSAVNETLSSGMSLSQLYASTNYDLLSEALIEVFETRELVDYPELQLLPTAAVEIDADVGGSVMIREMQGVTLNDDNPRMLKPFLINSAVPETLTLTAQPDEGKRFVRWVGCSEVLADQSCRMTISDNANEYKVSAQFGLLEANLLQPGLQGIVKLGHYQDSSYQLTYDTNSNLLTIDSVIDNQLLTQLMTVSQDYIIATQDWRHPLLRVVGSGVNTHTNSFTFNARPVSMFEVYETISTFEDPNDAPTIDDIAEVIFSAEDEANNSTNLLEHSSAGQKFVWIPGYGKAIDIGKDYFIANDSDGKGFVFLYATSGFSAYTGQEIIEQYGLDAASLAYKKTFYLGGNDKSYLVGKFDVALNVSFETLASSANLMWSLAPIPGISISGSVRGLVEAEAKAALFLGLQFKKKFTESIGQCGKKEVRVGAPAASSPQALANGAGNEDVNDDPLGAAGAALAGDVDFCANSKESGLSVVDGKNLKIGLQLNKTTPDGAVFPLQLYLQFPVTAKGSLGLSLDAQLTLRHSYDTDFDLGASCDKTLGVTFCNWGKSQKLESKNRNNIYSKFGMRITANAEIEPAAELVLSWGIREVNEDLVYASLSAGVPTSFVGNLSFLNFSNYPADKAIQPPSEIDCGAAFDYAFGSRFRVKAAAQSKLKFKVPGTKIEKDFGEITYYSKEFVSVPIVSPKLFKGVKGVFGNEPCLPLNTRPAKYFEASKTWLPGGLNWTEETIVYTKNRKLALQPDGNFVLYNLERSNGGSGGVSDENSALWATATDKYYGSRVKFQEDGNLVVYSLKEKALWSSDTYQGDKKGAKLVLKADGKLQILNKEDSVVWTAAGS